MDGDDTKKGHPNKLWRIETKNRGATQTNTRLPGWRRTVCFLTFPLKALLSQEADHGQELGDLLQVHHGGVIQMDDGHGVFVVRGADSWILLSQARGRE